jgi:outer membrane protein OmpA-like peptidoglycan-associated protein
MKNKLYLLCVLCCILVVASAKNSFGSFFPSTYKDSSVVLIPFEYKQSALFHPFTYEVIDSVVNLLLKNDKITLTIKGFAQVDEGSDSVCKWLSEDRASFVKKYILGRGVQEDRIAFTKGMGAANSTNNIVDKNNHAQYFRAELVLTFPPPPPPVIADRDEDGILNEDDTCPDIFGYAANNGCPDSNAIIIPFGNKEDWLRRITYAALDSVIDVLQKNKTFSILIEGHAFKTEGTPEYCGKLAANRALLVKKYLISRNIAGNRITAVHSYSFYRPLNAAKNPAAELANCRVQIFIHR